MFFRLNYVAYIPEGLKILSTPKIILIGTVALFSIIAGASWLKKGGFSQKGPASELASGADVKTPIIAVPSKDKDDIALSQLKAAQARSGDAQVFSVDKAAKDDFPQIDRIFQLFSTGSTKLPIVETITYSSSVPWLKGRPAWVADYAAYYGTSRHFIARSLNGKNDYFSQKVSLGSKFNVFRKDKKLQFHLLIDVSRLKMGFYYVDLDTNERVLLKTYKVGLGRLDPTKPSSCSTPLGSYTLGDRIAVYQAGVMGFFQDHKAEMIRVFGTRWIPFDTALDGSSEPAKGYGIQGAPWVVDSQSGKLVENKEVVNKYDSDGCIRLSGEDVEEIFSIVITKPSFVHIVKDFHEARLPGIEVGTPTR